jgi:hypothetical protein
MDFGSAETHRCIVCVLCFFDDGFAWIVVADSTSSRGDHPHGVDGGASLAIWSSSCGLRSLLITRYGVSNQIEIWWAAYHVGRRNDVRLLVVKLSVMGATVAPLVFWSESLVNGIQRGVSFSRLLVTLFVTAIFLAPALIGRIVSNRANRSGLLAANRVAQLSASIAASDLAVTEPRRVGSTMSSMMFAFSLLALSLVLVSSLQMD